MAAISPLRIAAIGICAFFAGAGAAAPPEWIYDFERGAERARRANKPAFVYFDAAWCNWCQVYKRDTLSDARVGALLRDRYVSVQVDFDARPDLMHRYRGSGLPFTVMLAPDGTLINRFTGVLTADDLHEVMVDFSRRPAAPAEPRQETPPIATVGGLDRRGYEAFQRAYLVHLESLYDERSGSLSGRFESGATLKRPSPLTWLYLDAQGLWRGRTFAAVRAERERLWDRHDGGFFNFLDPSRFDREYVETSKILESNAWLIAWLARAGSEDQRLRATAATGWFYLRDVLWDARAGGFWQAQIADTRYYDTAPSLRLRLAAPAIDRAKRADTNAQTAIALARYARAGGRAQARRYAEAALAYVLRTLWAGGALYHIERDGRLATPDLPQDWLWVLAAGAELGAARPELLRDERLTAIARKASVWLERQRKDHAAGAMDNEILGLIAWLGVSGNYRELTRADARWALLGLRLTAESAPDDLALAMSAWSRLLD